MPTSDLAIINALVADGSGTKPFLGFVVVKNGLIAEVAKGAPPAEVAENIFDAQDDLLTPGFIDPHGHSDISILANPDAYGKISQGVTTEIFGNCGLSAFPVSDLNRDHLEGLFSRYNVEFKWSTAAEFAETITNANPAINVVSLLGHNTLRAAVMGYAPGNANKNAIKKMRKLALREARATLGMSLGLLYVPGEFASEEELAEVARTAPRGLLAAHLRNEGDNIIEALEEFIRIGEAAGIPKLHVSHLKVAGKNASVDKLAKVLDILNRARKKGIRITADAYPYTQSLTQLSVILPPPWNGMGDVELETALRNAPAERHALANALKRSVVPERWRELRLVSTSAEIPNLDAETALGHPLAEIADKARTSPAELCAALLADDAPGTTIAATSIPRDVMERVISLPWVACCTDETARPADYSLGRSHPRGFGAFPKFLKLTDRLGLPLEEAVRRATSLPAGIFGLEKRGAIKPGFHADLALINMPKLLSAEQPDFSTPHKINPGIRKVWVNGTLSYDS